MDQYISSCGKAGHTLLIDCRDRSCTHAPLDDPTVSVLVVNSGVSHELSSGDDEPGKRDGETPYAARVRQCREAVAAMQAHAPKGDAVASLRDATARQLEAIKDHVDDFAYRRARHVITEAERTQGMVAALRDRTYVRAGQLLLQGHRSLQHDYNVSTDELDTLVDIAINTPGVYGARMTGGGFGGCIVALVDTDAADSVITRVKAEYKAAVGVDPECYVSRPGEGARVLYASATQREARTQLPVVQVVKRWIGAPEHSWVRWGVVAAAVAGLALWGAHRGWLQGPPRSTTTGSGSQRHVPSRR
jgi:galactokinase